jgi:hypothetical protein
MAPTDLEVRFHQEMVGIYDAAKPLGYQASYFREMVFDRGGVETAHALMASPEVSEGFRTLYGIGHLELSVEAHVVRPEYEPLFSSTEIATARRRLLKHGFATA